MITVEDFKKLSKLESKGYHIFVDGEEVHGLQYDEEEDWTEYLDAREEQVCTFLFVDDRYTTVQCLSDKDLQNANWTVEKHKEVDWRAL